ncbi:chromosome segregation SMC family protein [Rhizobium ruizarguesonis]|uniref:chromosome segregation SMC family protein n=1 Tax=Rhizobium ruizarguesonis TaxID=2081791 RepID=UPI00103230CA|nr:chromosome segregation SMC family protein [Rhizobium ruizarguesonis]TBD36628.1 chromosome segregation protein SMC [Rhizobium ruizarguesonis]TBD41394.1 chromosome segregation protein SMC [Rhizobium ruizarguesonis]TBD57740.1 chromosome segregation protein SMC [Rhizobium ruizarguesonis]TBD84006.1 chromosome segregation protein SMC [Rhizobium ruizarguesonis]TBD88829.1 chromosome segregation protein SMC [Rhizobium ruizarguesonis]
MKFNKLRLVGFKSFVEPTEFIIERGLTGVVGPNGCGKSNLVEALRWVMGENSYKNMRASGMDDVIFSGSGNRPARNTAEVALYLDNGERTAPAAFNDSDEIQVTRRIEREQGSLYRINGKESRAKDVQLLFADASTGARSPSMVGQGRIGELIQAKPQARRQLLEEAAGISGLHSRRHEAELRLRAAEGNLERLDDVTSQLESQIESLKRQARQANRFKTLSADIRAREAMLLHIRWVQAKEAEAEADSALNQATSVVAEKAQMQMEAAKNQAIASLKLPELREGEARAAAALQRLQIARSQLEEDAGRILRRRDELTRRLAQLAEDISREQRLVADNAVILARLDAEEAEISEILADSGRYAEETREAFEGAAAKLADSERIFTQLTAERAEAAAGRNQLERAIRDLTDRRMRLERQMDEANQELSAVGEKIAGLPDPDEKRAIVEAGEIAVADAEAAVQVVEQALAAARQTEALSRAPVEQARSALNALETEARTISRMLAAGAAAGKFPPVADELKVDRGFETALGAALGDDLESPLDAEAPAHWSDNGDGAGDPALPSAVAPLLAHVRAPAALTRRLRQIGLVAEGEAQSLMAALKPGQRLVTKEGAVYRWDGHVTGADAPSAAALRLAQKNRLAELESEAALARDVLAEAEERQAAAAEAIRAEERRLAEARDMSRLSARHLADARDALVAAERASGDLIRRRDVVSEAASQLRSQLEEIAIQEENARIELEDAPDLTAIDERLRFQQAEVATDRGALAESRARHESLARENEARQRRIMAIGQERDTWRQRAASAEDHVATLREREEEARDEAAELELAPDEFDDKRRALLSELQKAEEARRQASDLLAEAERIQREADQKATTALSELAECRERRGRAEERLVSAREKRQESEGRIREVLNVAPHEALQLTGRPTMQALPDPREVERELERLRIERERLGAVNLRADEEQKELSEKLEALIKERDDVIDAIRKLRGAIQSLNREGRERLIAAFDIVNAQFQRLFTHLFGGGTAELQLIESDDPLEAGLEILARPPGKKPQTMTLLSGGEQALTAMALIFAVFLTNPAPICVLDEVDAPLDDHNVERYCNLMDEMAASTETRFVIITHNPITMARMNRLFGVTMAEQGVSQLVSVDLQMAERLREIA